MLLVFLLKIKHLRITDCTYAPARAALKNLSDSLFACYRDRGKHGPCCMAPEGIFRSAQHHTSDNSCCIDRLSDSAVVIHDV